MPYDLNFKVYAVNKWNHEMFQELVAAFDTLERAEEYTAFLFDSTGEVYRIKDKDGSILDAERFLL